MEEDSKRPSHISYKEYQKKVTKNPNEGIAIFVSAFFILLLLFLGIAKQISPEVDVSIGGDESSQSTEDSYNKASVDERLKLLQDEDAKVNEEKMFAEELEEKVVIPDDKKSETKNADSEKQEPPIVLADKDANPKPEETASPAPKVSQPQSVQAAKVVVGYYATKEQAEVAKGIIAESGLSISPFVRSIGGAYTIQVGSYTSREKAQTVVNDLLRNNYPARVIVE